MRFTGYDRHPGIKTTFLVLAIDLRKPPNFNGRSCTPTLYPTKYPASSLLCICYGMYAVTWGGRGEESFGSIMHYIHHQAEFDCLTILHREVLELGNTVQHTGRTIEEARTRDSAIAKPAGYHYFGLDYES